MEETLYPLSCFAKMSTFFLHCVFFHCPSSTRLCNLLWYVCSRGPLRPNLPHGPPTFLSLLPTTFHTERCITASWNPAASSLACPLGTPGFNMAVTLTVACVCCCNQGRKDCQACVCCDRTGNMWTCSRSFATSRRPPLYQTHRPLFWMYRFFDPT